MISQRQISLQILFKTIKDESYSNLLMREKLKEIPKIKRAFCTELINGVLRNYEFLNYQFEDYIDKKINLFNRLILCMATYERFYLKQEDYVVNNEYVNLAESKYDKSFINAVLHKITNIKKPSKASDIACLPDWIYNLLQKQYEPSDLKKIIEVFRRVPNVYYRINTRKVSSTKLIEGVEVVNDKIFKSEKSLIETAEFRNGYFYIQDYNSAMLYEELDLFAEATLLDMCSAPGSKLFNCLDIIKTENAYANDLHENRVQLINNAAKRLGYQGINLTCHDACKLDEIYNFKFDRIMLDAPCSGLGVIGRKPDLKFHIKPESLDQLQDLQAELLECASKLIKDNGIILYSTCTLNKKENVKQIEKFIKNNPKFSVLKQETIINDMGDCFYYCKLVKESL